MRQGIEAWDISLSLACYFFYAWGGSCFLKRHLQGTVPEARVFAGLLLVCYVALAWGLEGGAVPYILYILARQGALVGLALTVFRGEKEKTFLAAIVLVAMTGLVWNFAESFLSCLGLFLLPRAFGHGQAAAMEVWAGRGVTLMTWATGLGVICLLSKPLEPVFTGKRKSCYLGLAIPLFCIVLVTDLANWAASNGIVVHDWGRYGVYANQFFSHIAMCLFTGLAMGAAGALVFGMERMYREERAGEEYGSQVRYYQMMEEQYGQMERLRHDMKNHVIALEGLVENRQWEKAKDYLKEMAEAGGVEAGDEVTGSLVMDALFYQKRRQALQNGIRWQCDARMPVDCAVKDMDLCIIMGNILDNALEACGRLPKGEAPFIRVWVGTIKKCLFLEVQNSSDLKEGWKPSGDRRGSPGEHGLGLGNIQAAAARYNGAVHMEAEKGIFTISVLLPLVPALVPERFSV